MTTHAANLTRDFDAAQVRRLARPDLAIVTFSGADGGVEKCDRELAMHVHGLGRRVVIVNTLRDFVTGRLGGRDISVMPAISGGDRQFSLGRLWSACRLFRLLKPRAVVFDHTTVLSFTGAMLAARMAGVPRRMAILYSSPTYPRPANYRRKLGVLPGWWDRRQWVWSMCLNANQHVLFATREHLERFARDHELEPRGWEVVPHLGADTEEFRPRPDLRDQRRQRLGVSDGTLCIGFVGRLSPEKGIDLLLRALAMLKGSGVPPFACLLAGDGPLRQSLEDLAATLGLNAHVRFLGRLERPAELMAAADIVAVPSREECFGLSLVEAMATEAAVVASTVGGMQEILTSGQDGLAFPPENVQALADALRTLMADADLRVRLGRLARQTVLRRYSMRQVLDRLTELLLGEPDSIEP